MAQERRSREEQKLRGLKSSKFKSNRHEITFRAGLVVMAGSALLFIVLMFYLAIPWVSHVFEVAEKFWFGL